MFGFIALLGLAAQLHAAEAAKRPAEEEYYRIITFAIPEGIVMECGGFEMMPDGRLAVSTRKGEIYFITGAFDDPPANLKYTKWASGLHESLGLAYRDGWLYAVQRGEVTRLKDTDGDDRADVYESFCDDWGITGDYHEYPFMSKFDGEGNLWVVHCLTGSFSSEAEFRGWALRITPEGKMIPSSSGIRSPGGIGFNHLGDIFYTDNQGPWNGTSGLKQLAPGAFVGHPGGNKWYSIAPNMGARPKEPESKSRFHVEAGKIPEFIPPVNLLPHGKVGQSASGIELDKSGGKFGPFANHLFVGDQHHSNLTRVVLDKVNGRYNSVAIPFRKGFGSGVVPVMQAPDGSMFVGGTNRGWGSIGPKEFALERLVWTGKMPFEIHEMKVTEEGFALTFTEPVDRVKAEDVASYAMSTYTYIYQGDYGSPEVDASKPVIKSAKVSADGKRVELVVHGRQIGHVHELKVEAIRSSEGKPLVHPVAYYTLWNVPGQPPFTAPVKDVFIKDNLVAWCIVPFDARQRTPRERAEMMERLGIKRFAYDWRDQHLASFEEELAILKEKNIELTAVWFPAALNREARFFLDTLKKHNLKTQLWVSAQVPKGDVKAMLDAGAGIIRPIAQEAEKIGCTVALYNHGGMFGEPEYQVGLVEKLKKEGISNVGIVYNQHHGHDHVDRFAKALELMRPHLMCLNLNGMVEKGDQIGKKILPVGQGTLDAKLMKVIRESGYQGPIGILNHTDEDAEKRLKENLEGLERLKKALDSGEMK